MERMELMEKNISNLQNDGGIRTIITNAVYGKTTKSCKSTVHICPEHTKTPDQVLGCNIAGAKIIEYSFEDVSAEMGNIKVNGSFDVHLWYESNGDTYVEKTTEHFSNVLPVKNLGGEFFCDKQVLGKFTKTPTSSGAMIINKAGVPTIAVQVKYELSVEAFGQAKLDILTYQPKKELKQEEVNETNATEFDFDISTEDDD